MKKLGHLGVFVLLVFLSVYLPELGIIHLTKFLGWGIDGYSVISLVWELVLVVLFVCWLKKKEMLYILKKKGLKEVKILLPCSWSSGYLFCSSIGGCFSVTVSSPN